MENTPPMINHYHVDFHAKTNFKDMRDDIWQKNNKGLCLKHLTTTKEGSMISLFKKTREPMHTSKLIPTRKLTPTSELTPDSN